MPAAGVAGNLSAHPWNLCSVASGVVETLGTVACQYLDAGSERIRPVVGVDLAEVVVEIEGQRIPACLLLPGIRRNVRQLHGIHGMRAREANAESLRRIAHRAGNARERIDRDAIGEGSQSAGRRLVRGIGQHAVAVVAPLRRVPPEDAVDLVEIGHVEGQMRHALVDDANGIECLLVLPPADVTDEAVVVEHDALAPHCHARQRQTRIGQLQAIQLGVARIGELSDRRHCR